MKTSEARLGLGEGPLWHPLAKVLYVTDIYRGVLHVFDADLNLIRSDALGRVTSAMTWQEDGSLLLFQERCRITRWWPEGRREVLVAALPGAEGTRFNDVIADPAGRVLCGTEPGSGQPGRLYSVDKDLQPRVLIDQVQEPNGMGFSPDHSQFYFSDSVEQVIWRYSYDVDTGDIGGREEFFRTRDQVLPDGLTVDAAGNVWTALWDGGCVLCLSPGGNVISTHELPARRTTSVAFGGAEFSRLFITSARDHGEKTPGRSDGATFALDDCGQGRGEFPSNLG